MDNYKNQTFWNIFLLIFSVIVLVLELMILYAQDRIPTEIGLFDLVLITLATFRLTRLFVYDSIMQFVRDWFLNVNAMYVDGRTVIRRTEYDRGIRQAIGVMFGCPWCTGLQVAMVVVFLYYLSPISWIVIVMFAVAGVATFIQLVANMVGWRAEYLKRKTEDLHPDDHLRGSSGGRCG